MKGLVRNKIFMFQIGLDGMVKIYITIYLMILVVYIVIYIVTKFLSSPSFKINKWKKEPEDNETL